MHNEINKITIARKASKISENPYFRIKGALLSNFPLFRKDCHFFGSTGTSKEKFSIQFLALFLT